MILVAYRRTEAGARQRAAERGRTLVIELPAPKVQPKPVVAPEPRQRAKRPVTFRPLVSQQLRPHTPLQRIIDLMSRMHGVSFAAVMSTSRNRHVCLARFAAICAVYQSYPDMTLYRIGQRFGRDHSTICHAFRVRGVVYVPATQRQGIHE